jgi:hypothetical protein
MLLTGARRVPFLSYKIKTIDINCLLPVGFPAKLESRLKVLVIVNYERFCWLDFQGYEVLCRNKRALIRSKEYGTHLWQASQELRKKRCRDFMQD